MLTYHHWRSVALAWRRLHSKHWRYESIKYVRKIHMYVYIYIADRENIESGGMYVVRQTTVSPNTLGFEYLKYPNKYFGQNTCVEIKYKISKLAEYPAEHLVVKHNGWPQLTH